MRRSVPRSRTAFIITLVVTLILALLPSSWLARLDDVGNIVNSPLVPMRHGAGLVAQWLRPPPMGSTPDLSDESLAEVFEEKEVWRQRYKAAELRVKDLEQQLEQLQRLPVASFTVPVRPVNARVTGRNPKTPGRTVELNRGTRQGIEPGTIAVFDGVHLVGRVSEAWGLRSVLVPVTSETTGLIRARVSQPDVDINEAVEVQLEPRGDGTLVADVDKDAAVATGDRVLLSDAGWPLPAQAMILGTVEEVRTKDEQPLRNQIVVRPDYQINRLSSVTLVVPMPDQQAQAEGAMP